ncbi:PREDICTED: uncharacterized protein LOC109132932 [Camelina sativa]|uniref:Uncharacterized protein LOC109132932 n=1 Tax=Camelina sativa TaxID=90675 RepID=A0ABM1RPK9_CAMSA|nr:PREDICTED: uncharacterized protein LOC109132932 [Camelina sativa]
MMNNDLKLEFSLFESFLRTQALLGIVNGAVQPPAEKILIRNNNNGRTEDVLNPDFESWSRSDQVVKAWLLGSMTENVLRLVVGSATAQEIKECQITLGIKDICDQLASIGDPVSEKKKIFAALRSLGREYEPINTVIEFSMDRLPAPTYDNVISCLTGYDDRLQGYSVSADVSPHLAFNTTRSSNYSHRGRGNRGRGRGSYSTRGRGFHKQFSSSASSPRPFSTSEKPFCQICGKRGHNAFECWYRFDEEYQQPSQPAINAAAFSALHITDVIEDNSWYQIKMQRLISLAPFNASNKLNHTMGLTW